MRDFGITIRGRLDDSVSYDEARVDFLRQGIADLLDKLEEDHVFDGDDSRVIVETFQNTHELQIVTDAFATYDARVAEFPHMQLNDHVDRACYVEEGVVKCRHVGNTFTTVIDGFPVDVSEEDGGAYFLFDSVFNAGEMPKGWDDVRAYRAYEDNQLTPWLTSMGFTNIRWEMGEADSFGPLSRIARMRRGEHRFIFCYG